MFSLVFMPRLQDVLQKWGPIGYKTRTNEKIKNLLAFQNAYKRTLFFYVVTVSFQTLLISWSRYRIIRRTQVDLLIILLYLHSNGYTHMQINTDIRRQASFVFRDDTREMTFVFRTIVKTFLIVTRTYLNIVNVSSSSNISSEQILLLTSLYHST